MSQYLQTQHPGVQFSHILSQLYDYVHFYQSIGFEGVSKRLPQDDTPPAHSLEELEQNSRNCQACARHEGRTHVVFGSGNPHARLMFIGDAPNVEEDGQGIPFSGESGALLTRIIEAIQLRREDVYLSNIIKCRPSAGHSPVNAEIAQCASLLHQQIEQIQPKIICALGTLAAQSLLGTTEPLDRLRGKFHRYHGILVMPTYHPAHLLAHPEDKRQVWHDIQMVQKAYNDTDEN